MKGLDKGGQGPTSGCCAIEEEEEPTASDVHQGHSLIATNVLYFL
jgi:hypothetical protein